MTPRDSQIPVSPTTSRLLQLAALRRLLNFPPGLALQWHYRILQAMALEEDIPDQPDDKTIPKYKQIDKVTNFPHSHSPLTSLSFFPKIFYCQGPHH